VLHIKPSLTPLSSYERQLKTTDDLLRLLDQVSHYKAFRKFEDFATTSHRFYFTKPYSSSDTYDFVISPRNDTTRDYETTIRDVTLKDIPTLKVMALKHREKLIQWQQEDCKDYEWSGYRTTQEIEQCLNEVMTKRQFEIKRKAIITKLKEIIGELNDLRV
jgi:hypothetical protein